MRKIFFLSLLSILLLTSASLWAQGFSGPFGDIPEIAHATDCSGYTAEGAICWDTDDDVLYVGTGTVAQVVGSGATVEDTPVNGHTTVSISSNWAYGHEAAADPHTGYMLESNIGTGANNYVQLSATPGTPDGTKFLRDDLTWAAASGSVAVPLSLVGAANETHLDITLHSTQTPANPAFVIRRPSDSLAVVAITSDNPLNTFIGSGSGESNVNDGVVTAGDGKANTFVGYQSGQENISGKYNTGLGTHSLNKNTEGYGNTAIGPNSGFNITTGDINTVVGYDALNTNATGNGNTAIGYRALFSATSGTQTAIGAFSLQAATTGAEYNTGIGYNSLSSVTTGDSNFGLGLGAGTGLTTGSSNFIVGTNSTGTSASSSNEAVIGSDLSPFYNIYFGKGVVNATPVAYTINGTGGSGTNIAGAAINIAGGKGTGNAAGGPINFQTSDAGASGTTPQSLTTKVTFAGGGIISSAVQALSVTTEADVVLTSSKVLVTGDNDADNDVIDLQNGTYIGQELTFIAVAAVDADDTVTVAMTDTTCTGCSTVLMDEIGDTWSLIWTGSTWAITGYHEVP